MLVISGLKPWIWKKKFRQKNQFSAFCFPSSKFYLTVLAKTQFSIFISNDSVMNSNYTVEAGVFSEGSSTMAEL